MAKGSTPRSDGRAARAPRREPELDDDREPGLPYRLTSRENAARAVIEDLVRLAAESAEREESRRMFKAVMLAGPSLEVAEALLRGERVPADRLDAEWVARFGRREA
jgi:hypothetical protein